MQSYALRLIKDGAIITNHYYTNMMFVLSMVINPLELCLLITIKGNLLQDLVMVIIHLVRLNYSNALSIIFV